MSRITVVVAGAKGKMGREVVAAVTADPDLELVGEVDEGDSLADILRQTHPAAMVDFTVPGVVLGNIRTALEQRVVPIVGTTGLSPADRDEVSRLCREHETGALIASNFAIGAVLLMRFCAEAARYLPDAEIVEMHHGGKLDSPSGTAISTAEKIAAGRESASPASIPTGAFEKIPGARGANAAGNVPIHSVRLPGFVASEMVIFGGVGQTLTIRHDSLDRKSFMPGVLLALHKAPELASNGGALLYGLECLME